jgi:hypothetical protein
MMEVSYIKQVGDEAGVDSDTELETRKLRF